MSKAMIELVGVDRVFDELVPKTTQNFPWPLDEGTYLTQREGEDAAQVEVIGPTVRRRLFGPVENPLGMHVLIDGLPL